ncbi:MAG: hypothetical protein ACYS5W_22575 [Planctomycetota bacterium]
MQVNSVVQAWPANIRTLPVIAPDVVSLANVPLMITVGSALVPSGGELGSLSRASK